MQLLPLAVAAATAAAASYDSGPCKAARASAAVAGPREPGTRIVVSGQVFQADGRTPAAGVTMYVYQTDTTGRYGPSAMAGPRLRAWLKTDSEGRYEYSTIRPAPYPNGSEPAHIHVQFWSDKVPLQYARDLLFEDDPLVTADERRQSAHLESSVSLDARSGGTEFCISPRTSG
jgi:protocatechuate 3,4-dioxygenase, beta subunit